MAAKTEHLWTSLADLWAVNAFPIHPLCSFCFCFDGAECRLWFSRLRCDKLLNLPTHVKLTHAQASCFLGLSGLLDLAAEVSQALGAEGSSLGRLFSRWCWEFSLSLRKNRERGEKTLYGFNWLVCVSQYWPGLPPQKRKRRKKTLPSSSPKWDT